jgi:putative ABC transport system permease protein
VRLADIFIYALRALLRQRFRSAMILLAMALGVASVVVLTGLGEGARLFVAGEFAGMGTDTLAILPGRQDTTGGMPPVAGAAPRDLTVADGEALRRIPQVVDVAPILIGASSVSFGALQRDGIIVGTTPAYFRVREMRLVRGTWFPDLPPEALPPLAVIGPAVHAEVFRGRSAVGEWLRVGDRRFRVVGVLGEQNKFGMNLGDAVFIPVNHAQALYDTQSMFRILAQVRPGASKARVADEIRTLITARHDGEEDITVISPDAMLKSLDAILGTMTLAVGGIGGISLLVAGILIMNVTLISVTQRTEEIGLLKALGAPGSTVRRIFLIEAGLMSATGALIGVAVGLAMLAAGRALWPSIPFTAPAGTLLFAVLVALAAGIVFALVPSARAAQLDPVLALTRGR